MGCRKEQQLLCQIQIKATKVLQRFSPKLHIAIRISSNLYYLLKCMELLMTTWSSACQLRQFKLDLNIQFAVSRVGRNEKMKRLIIPNIVLRMCILGSKKSGSGTFTLVLLSAKHEMLGSWQNSTTIESIHDTHEKYFENVDNQAYCAWDELWASTASDTACTTTNIDTTVSRGIKASTLWRGSRSGRW